MIKDGQHYMVDKEKYDNLLNELKKKNMANNKERQIATQSTLKLINDWGVNCGYTLSLKEIVAFTNVMVDYIENGYTKEISNRLEKIQEHLDNK
jgi:hypothetical protein